MWSGNSYIQHSALAILKSGIDMDYESSCFSLIFEFFTPFSKCPKISPVQQYLGYSIPSLQVWLPTKKIYFHLALTLSSCSDKGRGTNEKSIAVMKPEKAFEQDPDFKLVEVSPHQTLVEFQKGSTANPNNWSFVSFAGF